MRTTILSCILGMSLAALVACGDDDTTTTTTTATTSTASGMGGSGGSTTSGMGGSGPSQACIDGCNALFTCTQEADLCPGLKGADADGEKAFKDGCTSNALCDGSAGIVMGKMCPDMIDTIKGLSADFKEACEGTSGTGGAGGTSGTGGAGGN